MSKAATGLEYFDDKRPLDNFFDSFPSSVGNRQPYLLWADDQHARVAIREEAYVNGRIESHTWILAEDQPNEPELPVRRWLIDAATSAFLDARSLGDNSTGLVQSVTSLRGVRFETADQFQAESAVWSGKILALFDAAKAEVPIRLDWQPVSFDLLLQLEIGERQHRWPGWQTTIEAERQRRLR
ncbi:hypothetical protein HY380_00140 [Candidatus Saccharibacteria bacterium]|nr:hypothetical protein [Candidatus Saccharibacteria bacterium]